MLLIISLTFFGGGLEVTEEVRQFYLQMDGASFFWRARQPVDETLMNAYVAESHPTQIDWEQINGFSIVGFQELLANPAFNTLRVTERPSAERDSLAGAGATSQQIGESVRAFDRYRRRGTEDACVGLLFRPGQQARVVGITDSGVVDPRQPWMTLEGYLDYMMAMCGDQGGRYEFSGAAGLPSGLLQFDADSLASYRRGVLRPLS